MGDPASRAQAHAGQLYRPGRLNLRRPLGRWPEGRGRRISRAGPAHDRCRCATPVAFQSQSAQQRRRGREDERRQVRAIGGSSRRRELPCPCRDGTCPSRANGKSGEGTPPALPQPRRHCCISPALRDPDDPRFGNRSSPELPARRARRKGGAASRPVGSLSDPSICERRSSRRSTRRGSPTGRCRSTRREA